ncbi:MAG: hypothetical protein AB8F95_20985 [Bacteroidia bacterium]
MNTTWAELIFQYLFPGEAMPKSIGDRYLAMLHTKAISPDEKTQALLTKLEKAPWKLSYLDHYAAFFMQDHPIRELIWLMIPIAETHAAMNKHFLPQKRSFTYLIKLGFKGALVPWYMMGGFVLVKMKNLG